MKTPDQPPAASRHSPRIVEGRRFVLLLLGLSVVVILIAIGTYILVLHLRQKYGLPIT